MTVSITVTLSGAISERVQQLASRRQQEVNEIVGTLLSQVLPEEPDGETIIDLTEPDEAVAQEVAAYHRLHTQLWEKFPGRYVAIHRGQLVDYDSDRVALWGRVDEQFPHDFVLIRQVGREPERILYFRSLLHQKSA